MDFFSEWIVKKQSSPKDYGKMAAILVGGVLACVLSFLFLSAYLRGFTLLLIAGIIFAMYRGISSFDIEYEYSVTNGELDVDQIIARRGRKRLLTVHSKTFEYFAPYSRAHQNAYQSESIVRRIDAYSSLASENLWFAIYYQHNQKICLIFEPTEKMREDFKRYVPRSMYFEQ